MKHRALAFSLVLLLLSRLASAGGPFHVTGPAAAQPGQPFVWDVAALPIRYTVDSGPLSVNPSGATVVDHATGLARVQNMFQTWQSVPTTSISYSYAGPISAPGLPVGGDVKTLADFNSVVGTCNSGTQNPVVFDADGSIVRGLINDPLVIGFSQLCKLDPVNGHIVSALVLLNGEFQDGVTNQGTSNFELTPDEFNEAITHELGHFSGLDHSQINLEVLNQPAGNCDADDLAGLPLMFPVAYCQSRASAGLPLLAPDDMAWISRLYPNASFASSYGKITGTILFSDGITHAQGLNVIARRVDDPSTPEDESKRIAVSVVSGFLFTGNPGQSLTGTNTGGSRYGGRNPALIGHYEISVPPGIYTIQTESIDLSFTGGSRLGPLDPPAPGNAPPEFWHQYESAFDDPAQKDPITVQAGQTISGIDIILNGTPPRFDQFEDAEAYPQRPIFALLPRRLLESLRGGRWS